MNNQNSTEDLILHIPENPYLLLTPGPLSTSPSVRAALLRDWCTWDDDYNKNIVQVVRKELVRMAMGNPEAEQDYTCVLMQGSGSFCVESTLQTSVGCANKVLVPTNGAYGKRMVTICQTAGIAVVELAFEETEPLDAEKIVQALKDDGAITHVALVHGETTTGLLNPLPELAVAVKAMGKILLVDAMSTFGGVPIEADTLGIDFLISSANKCIQGVPGFGFIICRRDRLQECKGVSLSHCLDLYDQWRAMDEGGKWRFTSPTHVVRAFLQALVELQQEGGVEKRHARYCENQKILVEGLMELGLTPLLPRNYQSPVITSFWYPNEQFSFASLYAALKEKGFVIYPGKVSQCDTFRIGTIGHVYPKDIRRLVQAMADTIQEFGWKI